MNAFLCGAAGTVPSRPIIIAASIRSCSGARHYRRHRQRRRGGSGGGSGGSATIESFPNEARVIEASVSALAEPRDFRINLGNYNSNVNTSSRQQSERQWAPHHHRQRGGGGGGGSGGSAVVVEPFPDAADVKAT